MDSDQWKLASLQTLEHLERLGVKYLPKPNANLKQILADWHAVTPNGSRAAPIANAPAASIPAASTPAASTPANSTPIAIAPAAASAPAANASRPQASGQLPQNPNPNPNPNPQAVSPEMLGRPAARGVIKPAGPPVESPWTTRAQGVEERVEALGQLKLNVEACRLCKDIVCHRRQTVFGAGPVTTRFVMIGEAPGTEEDRLGEPFVGPAGELLDKILGATGIPREQVYIFNTLKCRPPNNRVPTDIELDNCRPYFEAQLEILQPEYIICWGATAVRAVLQTTESIGRLRGRFHWYKKAKVVVTYHPTYLLRAPEAKKLTWEDMQMLMRELGTLKA